MLPVAKTIAPVNFYLYRSGDFAKAEVNVRRSLSTVSVSAVDLSGQHSSIWKRDANRRAYSRASFYISSRRAFAHYGGVGVSVAHGKQ